jgi:hypothetical protein
MVMPPILVGVFLIATLLAKFSFAIEWIPAIAVGLIASGVVGFFLPKGRSKYAIYLLLGGIVLYFLAPHLGAMTIPQAQQLQVATWSVTPSAITSGVSLSGNQFIVPLTYNSTNNTLDKDPVKVSFVVTRTDTGTNDASFQVIVTPSGKITDPATGLQYDSVEKDSMQKWKIYIGDGTEFQDTTRVYQMKYGTSQQTLNVTIDLNPKGFDFLNNYESVSGQINVAGTTYTIVFQKVNEVA